MQDDKHDTRSTELLLEIRDQVAEIKETLQRIEGDHEFVKKITTDAVQCGYNAGAAAKSVE